jgi:DNA-binding MarR family transcriptional regulator
MGEIASHTAVPAPTATRVVDRLVAAGLAFRNTDPLDRRRVLVHLAARGRDVVERVCRRVERGASEAIGGSQTVQRAQLTDLLEALAARN